MSRRQPLLFPHLPRSRRRYIRMRVIDASGMFDEAPYPGVQHVRFKCWKCGAETDWEEMPNVTAARRGIPCHNCNTTEEKND